LKNENKYIEQISNLIEEINFLKEQVEFCEQLLKETKEDSNLLTTFGNNCIQNKSIIISYKSNLGS